MLSFIDRYNYCYHMLDEYYHVRQTISQVTEGPTTPDQGNCSACPDVMFIAHLLAPVRGIN